MIYSLSLLYLDVLLLTFLYKTNSIFTFRKRCFNNNCYLLNKLLITCIICKNWYAFCIIDMFNISVLTFCIWRGTHFWDEIYNSNKISKLFIIINWAGISLPECIWVIYNNTFVMLCVGFRILIKFMIMPAIKSTFCIIRSNRGKCPECYKIAPRI